MTDYFATLARYHRWATDRLLDAIAPLADDAYRRDAGLFFHSIHGTLNHLIVAEGLWFTRFSEGLSPVVALDAEVSGDRPEIKRLLTEAAGRWEPFVASIPQQRFAGRLDYRTMRGKDVSLAFAPTLGHVFNHGTHHRGQITAAISALGAKTPELDLVYMLQQEAAS
jgi:uncharacterized damage-inducible protein DinB